MKRTILGLAALLLPSILVFAAPDPRLTAIDAKASYRDADFSAVYRVIQSKPGQGEAVTVLKMQRRDRADQFVLEIVEPEADKGRGFFRNGATIQKYNPVEKRFDVTTGKDQLRNSNIRLSDFMGATFSRDYAVDSAVAATIGQQKVTLFTLKALNDQVTFPQVKLWVSADNLILRRADYSLSAQLLRTAITQYTTVAGRIVPQSLVMQDELRGATVNGQLQKERTAVVVSEPSFAALGDLVFSESYLEGKAH